VARNRAKLQREFEIDIHDLSHDGRGVGRVEGKAVFVAGALPGERVRAKQTGRNRHFDEAETLEVLQASPDRVPARCPHFGTCAGCVLQHLAPHRQIEAKQRVLLENLSRIGHVEAARVLPPLVDAAWGYRRKGRLSVRFVEKKGRTVVGFRESNPRFVAELGECHTILPELSAQLPALAALVDSLEGKRTLPQIEFIAGDGPDSRPLVALVFRHLEPLSEGDRGKLRAFAIATGFAVLLQPGGIDSVVPLHPDAPDFHFALPAWDLALAFRPLDFIQVNAGLNQRMIAAALELLDPRPTDRGPRGGRRGRRGPDRAGARERGGERVGQRRFPRRGPDQGPRRGTVDARGLRQAAARPAARRRRRSHRAAAAEGHRPHRLRELPPGLARARRRLPRRRARLHAGGGRGDGHVPADRARRIHRPVREGIVTVVGVATALAAGSR
jgi:predicted RNA-binding protein with TRAM domain